jgi:hypothetical protein
MKIWIWWTGNTPYVQTIIDEFGKQGHEVVNAPSADCDALLSLQMGSHQDIIRLHSQVPHIPLYTYVWDCYEWIWDHGRGYDWAGYGELCKVSDRVFVPSEGQRQRLFQHWNIPLEKSESIPAYAQYFDYEISDEDYVCDPLRSIPDRHAGWVEKACNELGIPYNHGGRGKGGKQKSWDDYKKFIANSSFIICPWYEASTGGMSLMEGYNIGKEILICDSPYMGAKDYFGDRAHYFQPNYDSLKEQIKYMWATRPTGPSIEDKKEFCKGFSVESFVSNLIMGMMT